MRAIEAASAAILIYSGAAAVVVVEAGFSLHKAFKCAAAAGSKIHIAYPPFPKMGAKKAASFLRTPLMLHLVIDWICKGAGRNTYEKENPCASLSSRM
ncbi:hypothetical protein SDC9_128416 [bioreactor metagenome]|uniref:Uncharacterized protein n=1 Tax=bioreactor metagenome TaxID=1076179 RepID=A0A645CWW0_9ZZZZ